MQVSNKVSILVEQTLGETVIFRITMQIFSFKIILFAWSSCLTVRIIFFDKGKLCPLPNGYYNCYLHLHGKVPS